MTPPPILRHDLVLVGGGHAHAAVLKSFGMRPVPGLRLTLVSPTGSAAYSGMLPGLLAGHYQASETHVELRPLCRFAGAQFIQSAVIGIDLTHRRVLLQDRPSLGFDTLSLNTGSIPSLDEIPGAFDHGLPVKPVDRFLTAWPTLARSLLDPSDASKTPRRLVVVGGGAGGVELLLSLRHRWLQIHPHPSQNTAAIEFHLVTSSASLLPTHGLQVRRILTKILRDRGVVIHTGRRVVGAQPQKLICATGNPIPFDALIWATHASAPPWIAKSGLATDAAGFIAVHPSLQSTSHPFVFAAGDVASVLEHPRPKSGVFAVRQGPPLAENLRRTVQGQNPIPFIPQKRALNLLSTGDRNAIASYGLFACSGRWVWIVKDWIDRRWMRGYQELPRMGSLPEAPTPVRSPKAETSTAPLERRCGGCAAKVPSEVLTRVLARLRPLTHPDVLIGLEAPDDAAVVSPPAGKVLVQTVDTLRAFVDDPYLLGRIATLHCLNDIFAMGAEPHSALAHATVPFGSPNAVEESLFQLLSGVVHELNAHQTALIGGHSAEGPELQMGISANGFVSPSRMLRKAGLAPGDLLILTKPLGTGTLFAADMLGQAQAAWIGAALDSMLVSNQEAARCLLLHAANACTDVSGFGLLGHLLEMLQASKVTARLRLDALPGLEGSRESLHHGVLSSLHPQNLRFRAQLSPPTAPFETHPHYPLLFDPQTSGGLLAGVPVNQAEPCLKTLRARGYSSARIIGEVLAIQGRDEPSPNWVELQN